MSKKPFIVACIPAYNEEKTIATIASRAHEYVNKVIVCDDGSTDNTRKTMQGLDIIVKHHCERMGKGLALKTLFKAAKDIDADIVVTLDSDGTHLPEEIPQLLKPLLESSSRTDMVVGSRFLNHAQVTTSALNNMGNRLFNILTFLLTGRRLTDTQSGFRAFKKELLESIAIHSVGYEVESEITIKIIKRGFKIMEAPIRCGKSYRVSRLRSFRDGFKIFTTIIKTFLLD